MVLLLLILVLSIPLPVYATDFDDVEFIRAYDGDTITVTIPNIHPFFGKHISIHVLGIDTPEIRGKCVQETKLARKARDLVRSLLKHADWKLI